MMVMCVRRGGCWSCWEEEEVGEAEEEEVVVVVAAAEEFDLARMGFDEGTC